MSDNLILVIVAVAFFFWYRMQQAMAAALCQGGGISSGCGPSGLILGGQKIVVPGFGVASACTGRGSSSIFCCSATRQGPVQSPVIGPARLVPPATSYMPAGMAPQATTLPKPMAVHPVPIFNSPQALATPTPALCQYNALETTSPVKLIASGFTTGSIPVIGPLINNLTECFCKVNKLYGQALLQGYNSGKISRCAPTPARCAAALRAGLHATSGVRRAALGCCLG